MMKKSHYLIFGFIYQIYNNKENNKIIINCHYLIITQFNLHTMNI